MKDKKGNMLFSVLIAVIVGVVMLGVIFSLVTDRTTTFNARENLINYSVAPNNLALTKPTDFNDITTTISIINGTGSVTTICNLTTISETPYIRCGVNQSATHINVSYNYIKAGYYSQATTRTLGGLMPVLLAIGLISVIVLLFKR